MHTAETCRSLACHAPDAGIPRWHTCHCPTQQRLQDTTSAAPEPDTRDQQEPVPASVREAYDAVHDGDASGQAA